MRRLVVTLALALVALDGADQARAALATMSVADVPLRGERVMAAVSEPAGFDYVGFHWRGQGQVWFRVRTQRGAFGGWQRAEASDGPDGGTAETRRAHGWVEGEGVWVGRHRVVQVRASGEVSRVRAYTIRSLVSRLPLRRLSVAAPPTIVPRSGWQADETIRKAEPTYADSLQLAIVHHTAGSNDYTPEQAPAVVRAIELYQVKANGWNDIGYNALVDRYGTVYEGRYGGLDRNVVGAHAKGFNTGSFGIAVLGDFSRVSPPPAAVAALETTIAWRLDLAHADPMRTFTAVSGGNERFAAGTPVVLRGVSGHRDTGSTACPGNRLYALLPTVARQASTIGLPKVYEPRVEGALGGPVRFTARLSSSLPWTLRITAADAGDDPVYEVTGTGATIDTTWDSSAAPPGLYRWSVEVPDATPASGTVGSAVQTVLSLDPTTVEPAAIAPDGDGTLDAAVVSYRLSAAANVAITAVDSTGLTVGTVQSKTWRRSGPHTASFDGLGLPDGVYQLHVMATASGGRSAESVVPVAVTHTLAAVEFGTPFFTPNGDGKGDLLHLGYTLTQPAAVSVTVLRGTSWAASPFTGSLDAGPHSLDWDGSKPNGRLREGAYVVELAVTDGVATVRARFPFIADWTPPKLRILGVAPLWLRVSEPARLVIRTGKRTVRLTVERAGTVRFSAIRSPRSLTITAADPAGNQSTLRRIAKR